MRLLRKWRWLPCYWTIGLSKTALHEKTFLNWRPLAAIPSFPTWLSFSIREYIENYVKFSIHEKVLMCQGLTICSLAAKTLWAPFVYKELFFGKGQKSCSLQLMQNSFYSLVFNKCTVWNKSTTTLKTKYSKSTAGVDSTTMQILISSTISGTLLLYYNSSIVLQLQ